MGDKLKLFSTELTPFLIEVCGLLLEAYCLAVDDRDSTKFEVTVNIHLQNKVIVSRHTTNITIMHANERIKNHVP